MRPIRVLANLLAATLITIYVLTGCSPNADDYISVSAEKLQQEGASLNGQRVTVSGACVRMYQHGLALASCDTFDLSVSLDFDTKFDNSEIDIILFEASRYLSEHNSPVPVKVCGVYTQGEQNRERWIVVNGISAVARATSSIGSCP